MCFSVIVPWVNILHIYSFFQVLRIDVGPLITLWIGIRLLPLTRSGPVISLVLPVIWLLSWILPESMFYSDFFGNVMTCAVISDVSMTVYLSLYFLTATFLWFVLQFRFSSFGVFLVCVCMFVFVFLFVVFWRGGSFCLLVVVVVLGVVGICFWGGGFCCRRRLHEALRLIGYLCRHQCQNMYNVFANSTRPIHWGVFRSFAVNRCVQSACVP